MGTAFFSLHAHRSQQQLDAFCANVYESFFVLKSQKQRTVSDDFFFVNADSA